MTNKMNERWALITGASSGIGEAFARKFAKEGWGLVLVARSIERLHLLAGELSSKHGVDVRPIQSDLRLPHAYQEIYQEIQGLCIQIDALVNNAGFGTAGRFSKIDYYKELEMVDVNVKALLALTHLFLPAMIERRKGLIINVSSTASFQPIPYLATYSATKAFVTSLSEALWAECRGRGVQILNLCPGRTTTNFQKAAGIRNHPKDNRPVQTAEEVVDTAFRAISKNQPTVISGFRNRLFQWIAKLLPKRRLIIFLGRVAKKMGYNE